MYKHFNFFFFEKKVGCVRRPEQRGATRVFRMLRGWRRLVHATAIGLSGLLRYADDDGGEGCLARHGIVVVHLNGAG